MQNETKSSGNDNENSTRCKQRNATGNATGIVTTFGILPYSNQESLQTFIAKQTTIETAATIINGFRELVVVWNDRCNDKRSVWQENTNHHRNDGT